MARRSHILSLSLLAALALLQQPASAELICENLPPLTRQFLNSHVSQRLLTPEIEARAIETYLERLDSSRTLLLEEEAAQVEASLVGVFQQLREGDCSAITSIHASMLERHKQADAFAQERLSDETFALDESVELVLDPEKRGRPATQEERDAIFLKLLHFQLSNYLSAGETLEEARRLLRKRYELRVKRFQEIPREDVLASFLNAFASALDPHSNYLTADYLEDFRIQMSLSLEGIGVALMERDGYSVVDRVIPGGAASKLGDDGLQPKDKIIAVAEEGETATSIIDMPLRDAVKLIRGTKGTTVELTVLRQEGDEGERFPLSIVRDKIDLAEQAAKLRFEERVVDAMTYKLAIIELPSFYGDASPDERQCSSDIAKLLVEVQEAKADGLLLDLSRNGGGLLDHAVEISGFFIRKGEIVGVQDARGRLTPLRDRDNRILYSGPLVVHTSRMSASASEILAGALKDYRRAVITGDDHTFGKGTVQTVTPLPPGKGALKITTAVFFRPGGKSTQNSGVAADIVIPTLLSADDTGEIAQPFALPSEEIGPFLSSYANAISPTDRWSRVSHSTIGELARRSQERLDESEEFAELRERIAEVRESEGLVRLADLLKRREEAEAKEAGEDAAPESAAAEATVKDDDADSPETPSEQPAPLVRTAPAETEGTEGTEDLEAPIDTAGAESSDDDQDKLSPQVEEALNVLGDLVALSRSGA